MNTGRHWPVTLPFLSTRAALLLFGFVGLVAIPLEVNPPQWRGFPDHLWLDGWARFDSAWYWSLIERGYYLEENAESNSAFFPLFSWTAQALAWPLRGLLIPIQAFFLSGIVLSHVCFFVALMGLRRLVAHSLDDKTARRTLWLLCLYPFSYFFSACYSESLFLCLSVWAFHFASQRKWAWACALAALCSATRIPGFLVAIGLFAQFIDQHRQQKWRDILWFAITPLGVVGVMTLMYLQTGDPLAFVHAQSNWGRTPGLHHLSEPFKVITGDSSMDLRILFGVYTLLFITALFLGAVAWKRLGPGYALFALGTMAMVLATGIAASGRLLSVLFPLFISAASLLRDRDKLFFALCLCFVPFLVLYAQYFNRWYLTT